MHKRSPYLLTISLALLAAGCQPQTTEVPVSSLSDDEKALYAFGAAIGQQLEGQVRQLQLSPAEISAFERGLGDVISGRGAQIDGQLYESQFQALAEERLAAGAAASRAAAEGFMAEAASAPGAERTGSGLVIRTIKAGSGERPAAADKVRVHYHGTLTDGTVFDSSRERGQPAEFGLNQVIPCWTEGVQRMQVGETAQLVCPPDLAYGDRGAGQDIPPGATLIFEVELLEIVAN